MPKFSNYIVHFFNSQCILGKSTSPKFQLDSKYLAKKKPVVKTWMQKLDILNIFVKSFDFKVLHVYFLGVYLDLSLSGLAEFKE